MRLAIFISLLLSACADFDRASYVSGSFHFGDSSYPLNEDNPGFFITDEREDGFSRSVGVVKNSHGKWSLAATAAQDFYDWRGGAASVLVGGAIYPAARLKACEPLFYCRIRDVPTRIVPLVGLQARHDPFFAQVLAADNQSATITFGLTFSLGGDD